VKGLTFLDGILPTENLRFRDESLNFRMVEIADERPDNDITRRYYYGKMRKVFTQKDSKESSFELNIEPGGFTDSEIIVML
jgi:ATP-binding cassette, sub-family E, member 1